MRNLVQLKATTFYTRNSPTTGAILHGDPRPEADLIARFPEASEEDADYLEDENLAERYDGRVPSARSGGRALDVDERAAEFIEHHNEAEESVEATTGLSTRQTTVFERPIEELAGSSGSGRARLIGEGRGGGALADDAPPAGSGRRGARKTGDEEGGGEDDEGKTLSKMTTAELDEAAGPDLAGSDEYKAATTNKERAALIRKAREKAAGGQS